jgi:hypothetical protein
MSNVQFPHIHGVSWEMKKTLVTGTTIQSAYALGHETRISRGPDPLSKFTLAYTILDDGLAHDSLNKLEAFFRDRRGAFDDFLLSVDDVTKTTHGTVTGQALTASGAGNAPFVRSIGTSGSFETIFELAGVNGNPGSAPVVKMSGTPLTLSPVQYAIAGPGVAVSGTTYPGMVAEISASITGPITSDFTWYYRVRFEQDEQELDLFHYLLWKAQEVSLIEVRA